MNYINRLVSFCLEDDTKISGIVLLYNDEWTVLRLNPVDFILDGYALLRNDYIISFKYAADEIFREKVILLKEKKALNAIKVPIKNIRLVVSYLSQKFGAFQINQKDKVYIGRAVLVDDNSAKFTFEKLSPKGKWGGNMRIGFDEVKVIEFDTDYINSLLIVSKVDLKENIALN